MDGQRQTQIDCERGKLKKTDTKTYRELDKERKRDAETGKIY